MRTALAALVVLAGCDEVFDLERPPGRRDAGDLDDGGGDGAVTGCTYPRAETIVLAQAGPTPIAIGAGAIDHEPPADIAIAVGSEVQIFYGGDFQTRGVSNLGVPIHAFAVRDLNRDQLDDLVISTTAKLVIELAGATGFVVHEVPWTTGASALAFGDFDSGYGDVVGTLPAHLQLVLGGQATFQLGTQQATSTGPVDVAVGEVSGDSKQDLVAIIEPTNSLIVHVDEGANFSMGNAFELPVRPTAMVLARLGTRPHLDAVVASREGDRVMILPNDGTGVFGTASTIEVGQGPTAILAADLVGDGNTDILTVNQRGNSLTILPGLPGGDFAPGIDVETGAKPSGVAAAHFDNDGHLDLAVLSDDEGLVIHRSVCGP